VKPNDPRLLEARLDLGDTLDFGRHRPEDALPLFAEVIDQQTRIYGPDSATVARSLIYQGNAYQHQKQYDLALADFRRSLAIYTRIHHEPHADLMAVNFNIAGLELERGHLNEAAAAYEEAYRVAQAVFPEQASNLAAIRFEVGRIRLQQDRLAEAEDLLTSALGKTAPVSKALETDLCYAETLVRRGKRDAAKSHLAEVRATAATLDLHPDPPCRSWQELWTAAGGTP
jgi:tetratricopeptide (TPR) repeat protein